MAPPVSPPDLDQMTPQQLREFAAGLMVTVQRKDEELRHKTALNTQLKHEIAILRRWRFGKRGEQLSGVQASLLEDSVDEDLAAIERELEVLNGDELGSEAPVSRKAQPKRAALPPELPRTDIRHDPKDKQCACGCQFKLLRDEVSEKLDYIPGVFTVERHIRGVWACPGCESITQAPMPPYVIDKGLATPGLLAQVLVNKYADHLPLHRQESIFARAGVRIPRSTMAQWVGLCGVALQPLVDALRHAILAGAVVHADETPVQMLKPGLKKTHRAYLWSYAPGASEGLAAVVYDFAESRSGVNARAFFGDWKGYVVCDDYSGYKTCFTQGMTEAGCMAHARRKFHELHVSSQSTVAAAALRHIGALYEIERDIRELSPSERLRQRQEQARPLADTLHAWMLAQRQKVPEGSPTAKALDYSLKRWVALTRYLDDGRLPIDNNLIEQQIRPIAVGRRNWLFAGSLRAGKRAAAIMSLLQSAKLNGHDPLAYLKDVLTRLPTHPNNRIEELLPHRWQSLAS
jgi:Transposase and inactivated derivatives